MFLPLHLDIRVMLASAHQADYIDGNWLYAVLNSWELKGFLDRAAVYGLYKIANVFALYASGYYFEVLIKFFFFIIATGMVFASAYLACKEKKAFNINIALLTCSAIYASLIHSHVQAEMICVLILILAFAIYINSKINAKYVNLKLFISGFLAATTIFYKSIFALMALVFFAVIFLWNKRNNKTFSIKEILYFVMGGLSAIFIGFVVIMLFNPSEIEWVKNAGMYENTIVFGARPKFKDIWQLFSNRFAYSCLAIPVVFLGILAGFKNFVDKLRKKDAVAAVAHFVIWAVPSIVIILANKYFTYHYTLFMFSALFELYMAFGDKKYFEVLKNKLFKWEYICFALIVVLFYSLIKIFDWSSQKGEVFIFVAGLYIAFAFVINCFKNDKLKSYVNIKIPLTIICIVYLSYISIFSDNFYIWKKLIKKMYKVNKNYIERMKIDKKEQILYLDGGMSTYILGNKSYLEEHFPLSLQRITEGSPFENSKVHIEALERVLKYNGKYIVLNRVWFFGGENERNLKIQEKLKKEYHSIGEIEYVSVGIAIFKRQSKNDFVRVEIYERNK